MVQISSNYSNVLSTPEARGVASSLVKLPRGTTLEYQGVREGELHFTIKDIWGRSKETTNFVILDATVAQHQELNSMLGLEKLIAVGQLVEERVERVAQHPMVFSIQVEEKNGAPVVVFGPYGLRGGAPEEVISNNAKCMIAGGAMIVGGLAVTVATGGLAGPAALAAAMTTGALFGAGGSAVAVGLTKEEYEINAWQVAQDCAIGGAVGAITGGMGAAGGGLIKKAGLAGRGKWFASGASAIVVGAAGSTLSKVVTNANQSLEKKSISEVTLADLTKDVGVKELFVGGGAAFVGFIVNGGVQHVVGSAMKRALAESADDFLSSATLTQKVAVGFLAGGAGGAVGGALGGASGVVIEDAMKAEAEKEHTAGKPLSQRMEEAAKQGAALGFVIGSVQGANDARLQHQELLERQAEEQQEQIKEQLRELEQQEQIKKQLLELKKKEASALIETSNGSPAITLQDVKQAERAAQAEKARILSVVRDTVGPKLEKYWNKGYRPQKKHLDTQEKVLEQVAMGHGVSLCKKGHNGHQIKMTSPPKKSYWRMVGMEDNAKALKSQYEAQQYQHEIQKYIKDHVDQSTQSYLDKNGEQSRRLLAEEEFFGKYRDESLQRYKAEKSEYAMVISKVYQTQIEELLRAGFQLSYPESPGGRGVEGMLELLVNGHTLYFEKNGQYTTLNPKADASGNYYLGGAKSNLKNSQRRVTNYEANRKKEVDEAYRQVEAQIQKVTTKTQEAVLEVAKMQEQGIHPKRPELCHNPELLTKELLEGKPIELVGNYRDISVNWEVRALGEATQYYQAYKSRYEQDLKIPYTPPVK